MQRELSRVFFFCVTQNSNHVGKYFKYQVIPNSQKPLDDRQEQILKKKSPLLFVLWKKTVIKDANGV